MNSHQQTRESFQVWDWQRTTAALNAADDAAAEIRAAERDLDAAQRERRARELAEIGCKEAPTVVVHSLPSNTAEEKAEWDRRFGVTTPRENDSAAIDVSGLKPDTRYRIDLNTGAVFPVEEPAPNDSPEKEWRRNYSIDGGWGYKSSCGTFDAQIFLSRIRDREWCWLVGDMTENHYAPSEAEALVAATNWLRTRN